MRTRRGNREGRNTGGTRKTLAHGQAPIMYLFLIHQHHAHPQQLPRCVFPAQNLYISSIHGHAWSIQPPQFSSGTLSDRPPWSEPSDSVLDRDGGSQLLEGSRSGRYRLGGVREAAALATIIMGGAD